MWVLGEHFDACYSKIQRRHCEKRKAVGLRSCVDMLPVLYIPTPLSLLGPARVVALLVMSIVYPQRLSSLPYPPYNWRGEGGDWMKGAVVVGATWPESPPQDFHVVLVRFCGGGGNYGLRGMLGSVFIIRNTLSMQVWEYS